VAGEVNLRIKPLSSILLIHFFIQLSLVGKGSVGNISRVVTCSRGTSVARSLKLLALPYSRSKKKHINQHHCNPTQVVVIGESPCVTNTD